MSAPRDEIELSWHQPGRACRRFAQSRLEVANLRYSVPILSARGQGPGARGQGPGAREKAASGLAPAEGGSCTNGSLEGFLGRRGERRQVAHLAALEDLPFVVQVEVDRRVSEGGRDALETGQAPLAGAQEVDHRRRTVGSRIAQGQAADRPDVLLELAGRRPPQGPGAAVVDPPGPLRGAA